MNKEIYKLKGTAAYKGMLIFGIIYIIALLGGYKQLGIFISRKVINENCTEVNINIQIILYCFLIFVSVVSMLPLIKYGIANFKKGYFKDVFSILTIAYIVIAIIMVSADMLSRSCIVTNNVYAKSNIPIIFLISLIYAPVVEELFFRGFLFQIIKIDNKIAVIIISAIIFGILHTIQNFNCISIQSVVYLLIYTILGISCGASMLYTDSILGAILNHFYWNTLTMFIMILKLIF